MCQLCDMSCDVSVVCSCHVTCHVTMCYVISRGGEVQCSAFQSLAGNRELGGLPQRKDGGGGKG